jgi:hypothetical protein
MMEIDLRQRLLDDAAVAAIVGTRVDWTVRPQATALPAIVLQVVNDTRSQHMSGFDYFRQTRVQIDCYGRLRRDVVALREAVIAALADEAVQGDTEFLRAFVNNVVDMSEQVETAFIHRDMIDMTFWHGYAIAS